MQSVVQRAHLDEALAIVDQFDDTAFVTVEDPQVLRGGIGCVPRVAGAAVQAEG